MKKFNDNKYFWFITTFLIFIGFWEFAAFKLVDPVYIGTPHIIFTKIVWIFKSREFFDQILNSGQAFLIGYSSAVVFGIITGLILGTNKCLQKVFSSYIFLFNSLPYVALLPLLIIWFGLSVAAKTAIIFLMVAPAMTIYILDSTKTMDANLVKMADSFGAREIFKLKNIYFFHALPYIFSGMRVSIGRSLIAIIVAEGFGLGRGIAYYIPYYGSTFQTDKLMANVIIIIAFNFILITALKYFQKKVVFWHQS